jgi:hypothetical protein
VVCFHPYVLLIPTYLISFSFVGLRTDDFTAVVFANAAGPAEEGYAGLSQVAVPFIGPLAKLEGCEEDMLVVDLDLSVLEEADRCYGIREDLASEDWHYEYRHTRTEDEGA